ncbi:MAG: hypothetical protein HRO68_10280 [Nitrosopumilus sp.]|nr:hypothetical protein [Nitrosopumilus sp.]
MPAILHEYDSIIRKQIAQGIVQHVHPKSGEVGQVHYLPHHAVVRQSKETTKVRVVYDASAKVGGPSLNDCLFTGPKFDQKILDLLLRFRTYPVALTADVEKAFLMVSVSENDRDVLRFLWVDDVSKADPEIQVVHFARVMFGVSSSPFLLMINATIDHHLKAFRSTNPEMVDVLLKSMYVDDVIAGAMDEESALKFYVESKDILRQGGFNLRKFTTNAWRVQENIDKKEGLSRESPLQGPCNLDETYAESTLGCAQTMGPTEQAVLGVKWDVATDRLIFSVSEISALADDKETTKRRVTSVVGKFYDPLGFLSPVVVKFKMFFQELCEEGLEWDQTLGEDLLRKWQLLLASLQEAPIFSIPRYFLGGTDTQVISHSLHGFCDASKKAYAAVIYLVTQTNSGPRVTFLVSKTRVAPLREVTIPRLELLSALLLARLINNVTESLSPNLSLECPTCYTDSMVALCWIVGSDKEWKQFVQNRVSEIRGLLPISCWQHCPGCVNPADLPSRGLTPSELSVSKLWHRGPDWLWESVTTKEPFQPEEIPAECLPEMRVRDQKTHALITTSVAKVLKCEEYSSLSRLVSVTAYVLKFVRALKEAVKGSRSSDSGLIASAQELSAAEMLWIQESQQRLIEDKHFPTWKKQFGLYCDEDGVWRCGGRLHHANIPHSMKHPILLHRDHHLTSLVVMRAHQKVCHNGTKETLTEVRSQFWIVKGSLW